jgi:serine/threonine-protein kinase
MPSECPSAQLCEMLCAEQRSHWQRGDRVPAETYLAQAPSLAADPDRAVELVYNEVVLREELGEQPQLEEYVRRFPHLADSLQRLFAVHEALGSQKLFAGDTGQPPATPAPTEGGPTAWPTVAGYEILGVLGRGGMGVVYKARQKGLDRLVALKMVSAAAAGPEELARFRREAEAIARLQHPNIVQVHEVGETPSGPYYSMEFVDGGTLVQRLAGTPQPSRAAAGLLATLARAMHAAHRQRVVHRDLKPANVLLTADGVPKISDFGLAKWLAGSGKSSDGAGPTRTGDILGTPSYMAPEQTAGRSGRITPTADVYALGAILYEMLTGRPPFLAETPLETMDQVRTQEPVPPRRLQPKLPKDLETICLQCLHKEPDRRYPSALALAKDLERFLAGEPVRARPVGPLGRLARWCRRRPLVATLVTVSVLFLAGDLASVTYLVFEKEAQRIRTQEQLERITAGYRLARDAVDDSFTVVSEEDLLNEPALQPLRKKLLERSLTYYREFLRQREGDPELREELARIHFRVAFITDQIGSKEEALEAYRQALAVYEQMLQADPRNNHLRGEIAVTHNHIGIVLRQLGRPAEAAAAYRQGLVLREQLVRAEPRSNRWAYALAQSCNNLGNLARTQGQPAEAMRLLRRSNEILTQLAAANPISRDLQVDLAKSHANLGMLHRDAGEGAEALAALKKAHAVFAVVARDLPKVWEHQMNLAISWSDLATAYAATDALQDAVQANEKSRDLWLKLIEAGPQVTEYRSGLAVACANLGDVYQDLDSPKDALASYEQALDALEKLAKAQPTVSRFRYNLGFTYANAARALAAEQPEKALAWAQRAQALCQEVLKAEPNAADFAAGPGRAAYAQGKALRQLGRRQEAAAAFQRAATAERALLEKVPTRQQIRRWVSMDYEGLAGVNRELGRPTEAAAAALERQKLWPRSAAELYGVARELALCVPLVDQDRGVLTEDEKKALRGRHADQAMAALRQAVANGFGDAGRLRKDPDLEPLRAREDFQKLVAEVEEKAKTPAK